MRMPDSLRAGGRRFAAVTDPRDGRRGLRLLTEIFQVDRGVTRSLRELPWTSARDGGVPSRRSSAPSGDIAVSRFRRASLLSWSAPPNSSAHATKRWTCDAYFFLFERYS